MKSKIIKLSVGILPWAITIGVIAVALAFTGPGSPPPVGLGSISIDGAGNVGISTLPTANKLSVGGNVQWSGSLTAGSVPWARLTGFPNCPAGQFVTGVGASAKCAAPNFNNLQGAPTFMDGDLVAAGGVTSITAGTGLTSVPSPIGLAGGTLSITSASQNRITGTCPAGQAITSIAANGSVTCKAVPVATCTWYSKTYATGASCWSGGVQLGCGAHDNYEQYTCQASGNWQASGPLCSPWPVAIPSCGS